MLNPLGKNLARITKYTYCNSLMNWSHKISCTETTLSARCMRKNNLEIACSKCLVDKILTEVFQRDFPGHPVIQALKYLPIFTCLILI